MLKLYLKKLLWTILFFVVFILVAAVIYIPLTLIMSEKVYQEDFRLILSIILSIPVVIVALYIIRTDHKAYKRDYIENHPTRLFDFWKDYAYTLRSKENIVHTLAFSTLRLINVLPIGISESKNIKVLIVGTIILLLTGGVVFTIVNTFIWCFVHRKWLQGYKAANQMLS